MPGFCRQLGNRKTLLCVTNRRFQHVCQSSRTVRAQKRSPTMHRAGDGHRMNPSLRHLFESALATKVQARGIWRSTARVQRLEPPILRSIEQAKSVAADANRHRLDDAENG